VFLDHYVSQVHLKNFYSPSLDGLMYAIRKHDLESFTPNAKSVCRIEDGNTNSYLREDRVVEDFLKSIEPKYNVALEGLAKKNIDSDCIYTIAGFVAYVLVCSPAGMRIFASPLKTSVEDCGRILNRQGVFSSPPPGLGGGSLTELLNDEKIVVKVDPKYSQALGISSIMNFITSFGNSRWEVLQNPFDDSTFFTSDFPVALEPSSLSSPQNKIIPLAPNLAIRICPDPSLDINQVDLSFSNFECSCRKLNRKDVGSINKLIVRCAESVVFYRDNHDWVSSFVSKNSNFRIEPQTKKVRHGTGMISISTQNVVKIKT